MKKAVLFILLGMSIQVCAQQLSTEAKDVIKSIYTEALGEQQGYKWMR